MNPGTKAETIYFAANSLLTNWGNKIAVGSGAAGLCNRWLTPQAEWTGGERDGYYIVLSDNHPTIPPHR